jgi:hypothetical protein
LTVEEALKARMAGVGTAGRKEAQALPVTGRPPAPRAYHSADALGARCYVVGGRCGRGLVDGQELVACFDAGRRAWLPLPRPEGAPMTPRSSHRRCPSLLQPCLPLLKKGMPKPALADAPEWPTEGQWQ